MTTDESKLEILKKVQEGVLSVEEGSDLLGILEGAEKQNAPAIHDPIPPSEDVLENRPKTSGCWKAAWSMILVAGAVLTAFSAIWIDQGYQKNGFGWAFWLSWIPFGIGILIVILGWILMQSPWLNVNIRSRDGAKISRVVFSMPVPLRLASWVFRTFKSYMPEDVKNKGYEDMIEEIDRSLQNGDPFHIEVDEKEDGDYVDIFIEK